MRKNGKMGAVDEFETLPIYALLRNEPKFPGYEPPAQYKRWQALHASWESECLKRNGRLVEREEIISIATAMWEDQAIRGAIQKAGQLSLMPQSSLRYFEDRLDEFHSDRFWHAPLRALRFVEPVMRRFASGHTAAIFLTENNKFFDEYYRGDKEEFGEQIACPAMYVQTVASFLIQGNKFVSDFEINPEGWLPEEMRDPLAPRHAAFVEFQHLKSQARLAGGFSYCVEPESILLLKFVAFVLRQAGGSPTSVEARDFLLNYEPIERQFKEKWKPELSYSEGGE